MVGFGSAYDTGDWVWNGGNAESFPTFTVSADAPGGFSVGLGDKRVTYPRATFSDMPVKVDMAGSLSVTDVDQSFLLGERAWSSVPPASDAYFRVPTGRQRVFP